MALFAGTFENRVDRKGRVSVPAPFRAELGEGSGAQVFMFPAFNRQPAIEACPMEWMEAIKRSLNAYPLFSKEREQLNKAIFGRSRIIRLDDDGRLVLPKDYAALVGITDKACFVGNADTFQIWEPAAALKAQEDAMASVMEEGLVIDTSQWGV